MASADPPGWSEIALIHGEYTSQFITEWHLSPEATLSCMISLDGRYFMCISANDNPGAIEFRHMIGPDVFPWPNHNWAGPFVVQEEARPNWLQLIFRYVRRPHDGPATWTHIEFRGQDPNMRGSCKLGEFIPSKDDLPAFRQLVDALPKIQPSLDDSGQPVPWSANH
jgi:hypothetical protein